MSNHHVSSFAEFKSTVEEMLPGLREKIQQTPGIPEELAPALLSTSLNYLATGTLVPVLAVDYNRTFLPIPTDCDGPDLPRFAWTCLVRHAHQCVHLSYVTEDTNRDSLVVLFHTRTTFYKAIAPVLPNGELGEWQIERLDAQ